MSFTIKCLDREISESLLFFKVLRVIISKNKGNQKLLFKIRTMLSIVFVYPRFDLKNQYRTNSRVQTLYQNDKKK